MSYRIQSATRAIWMTTMTFAAIGASSPCASAGVVVFENTGWQAEWDASLDHFVDIDFEEVIGNTIFLEKSAQFAQSPIRGVASPIVIRFRQIGPSVITNFVIDDEIIVNSTGAEWNGFELRIENGGTTALNPAMTAASNGGGPIGFSIAPFTAASFADSNRTLNISGGMLENNGYWYPGGALNGGQLWIDVQSGDPGAVAGFELVEQPIVSPGPPTGDMPCRVTGGGNGRSIDYALHADGGLNKYTWGGQAGAPTAAQPQPFGEWTHRQHSGPAGKWTFHAGTSSAPDGTEIDTITCCDPGYCQPARPAPAHQITFQGIGTFKNTGHDNLPPGAVAHGPDRTYHWFVVHIEDAGEPGGHNLPPGGVCPEEGFNCAPLNCDCPDFYRITIYQGVRTGEPVNTTDRIYEVYGYIKGGNLQIHPPIGDVNNDRNVSSADLRIVTDHIGTHHKGDVNGDGTIDFQDVALVLQHMGESW